MRFAAFAVLLCACFDPGPAPLRCSEAQPGCPDGLVCLGGMCMDSTSGAGDMQVMDMMITDLILFTRMRRWEGLTYWQ
jgi:hypothetical protein